MHNDPYTLQARTVLYESPWIHLYKDAIKDRSGRIINDYHVIHFNRPFVKSIVINEVGRIGLVGQFRYPRNRFQWELPGGGVEPNESVTDAAVRETLEELGVTTTDHRQIYNFYPVIGSSTQHFYLTTCKSERPSTQDPDPSEIASTKWVDPPELRSMLRDNVIEDGYSLSGILWYLAMESPTRT